MENNDMKSQIETMMKETEQRTKDLQAMLASLKKGDNLSVTEMLELQMRMNQMAQMQEMMSNVIAASNKTLEAIVRNIKS